MKHKCNKCGSEYGYIPIFCPKCGTKGTRSTFTPIGQTSLSLKELAEANPKLKKEVIELCQKIFDLKQTQGTDYARAYGKIIKESLG